MSVLKNNKSFNFIITSNVFQIRSYAKSYLKVLKKDSEVHEFVKKNKNSKQNFLAALGVAGTGALGIKRLINNERQNGNVVVARRPLPIYFFNEFDGVKTSIRNVACGYGFTLFSGRSKPCWKVYGCGLNNESQLGVQDGPLTSQGFQVILDPTEIVLPCQPVRIDHIACGRAHSIVVAQVDKSDNIPTQMIYSFGNNFFGQCGRTIIENEIFFKNTIVNKIEFQKPIKQVECGEFTTYFLTEDGSVYGCGSNMYGQLANRDGDRSSVFLKMGGMLDGEVVKEISCRCNTVLALTAKGEVFGWGDNGHGLVYDEEDESCVTEPCRLTMPESVGRVVKVSAGNSVCAVVDEEGRVHTWGIDLVGLGPSHGIARRPTMIPPGIFGGGQCALDSGGSKVVGVTCGVKQCFAVTLAGSLYCWGEDIVIKNGLQTFPVRLPMTFNAKKVLIGADHCVIMGSPDV